MPSIPLHISPTITDPSSSPYSDNDLPALLQTPSGLALLEIQGQIHTPPTNTSSLNPGQTPVGELVFPHYDPTKPKDDTSWMKTVHLYVGKHQRMTGEVKKLAKPYGVVKRRENGSNESKMEIDNEGEIEELELVEIVRWKILFKSRPEPVDAVA